MVEYRTHELIRQLLSCMHASQSFPHVSQLFLPASQLFPHVSQCFLHASQSFPHASQCFLHASQSFPHASQCFLHASQCFRIQPTKPLFRSTSRSTRSPAAWEFAPVLSKLACEYAHI